MNGDPQALIQFLWRHGYFWYTPSGKNLAVGDLAKLSLSDSVVKDAVSAWQQADINFDIFSNERHGRAVIADGDVGPVTEKMLTIPRCPMPDVAPPPGTAFDYGDAGLNAAVASMINATGSGSWPVGCDPEQKTNHSIRVALNVARCPQKIKDYLTQALTEVSKAYAEVGLAVRYIVHETSVSDSEIDKRFESLGGSVIGWNEFPTPNTCQQTIDGRLDTGYAPTDWRLFANLECHETGHGVGLQHGRGSIMNPSIIPVWPLTWVGTYSYPNLKRWFGGEPIKPSPLIWLPSLGATGVI